MGAHLFHDLQHVRAIENSFPLLPQRLDQVLQNQSGCHIKAGKRLIEDPEDQQFRVVHKCGNEQDALPHSLRVGRNRGVPVRVEREQVKKRINLSLQA